VTEFEYSTDALNAKSAFFRVQTIVYVEGDDDVLFWHEVFSKDASFSFKVEALGGSKELDKYISLIEQNYLRAIAARDSDYLGFKSVKSSCKKVLYTYGYSIENSLYTPNSIHGLVKLWSKNLSFSESKCSEWLKSLATHLRSLLILDIANYTSGAGLNILRDNCTEFMTGKYSHEPCPVKIANVIQKNRALLSKDQISRLKTSVGDQPEAFVSHLRGHFLASAVAKYLSNQVNGLGKKVSLAHDALYVTAMSYFSANFDSTHPHYQSSVKIAKESLSY
jgi:Protein of unknown function (DUF4435)